MKRITELKLQAVTNGAVAVAYLGLGVASESWFYGLIGTVWLGLAFAYAYMTFRVDRTGAMISIKTLLWLIGGLSVAAVIAFAAAFLTAATVRAIWLDIFRACP